MPAHPGRKPTYTPHPKLTASQAQRLEAVLQVAAGRLTVSEAARQLGLSRLHFQSLRHRGLAALAQALAPQRVGRKPKPPRQRQLEAQLKAAQQQKGQAQTKAARLQRLLRVARETLQAQAPRRRRTKRPAATPPATREAADEHPAPQPHSASARPPPPAVLEEAAAMTGRGLPAALAAAALGRSPSTLRRWRARLREGRLAVAKRGPHRARPPAPPDALLRVEALVRDAHGLPGARALARSVPGLSRRTCARVKACVLTRLEAERREACVRVRVAAPGLVRALDAVHVRTPQGPAYLLAGGDGHVPYRTGLTAVPRYTAAAVARALALEFEAHGAPLVARLDRAACHTAPEVLRVLQHHHVLLLQGPPHLPRYYGQLERQNRDARAWLSWLPRLGLRALEAECARLVQVLNTRWPREALGWRTPAQVWEARPSLRHVDRAALAEEVEATRRRLCEGASGIARGTGWAERRAIETVMTNRGWLTQQAGGWC